MPASIQLKFRKFPKSTYNTTAIRLALLRVSVPLSLLSINPTCSVTLKMYFRSQIIIPMNPFKFSPQCFSSSFVVVALICLSTAVYGIAQLAIYEFTGESDGDNQFNNVTSAPTGGTFSSFTRTGVGHANGQNLFASRDWSQGTSIDSAKYVSYNITPAEGNISYLQGTSFGSSRSGTGPASGLVSLFGNTNHEAIASQSFSPPSSTTMSNTTFNFPDVIAGEALTVRLTAWGATGSTGTLRFDNVTTTGTTTNFQANSANLTLSAGTQVYSDVSSLTLSGGLTGSGGITKIGSNTLNLTGASDYSGATTVSQGTLVVGVDSVGSITSNVSVNSGATLAGSGTITGNVNVGTGGTVAAGNSPGVLTVNGTSTYSEGSIFSWELNNNLDGDTADAGDTGTRGSNYDGLTSTSLSVASGAIFRVVLTDAAKLNDAFWTQTQRWTNIFSVSGTTMRATTGSLFDTFEVYSGSTNVTVDSAGYGGFTFEGNELVWSAVPEPTSALAGLLLGAGLLRRRRNGV